MNIVMNYQEEIYPPLRTQEETDKLHYSISTSGWTFFYLTVSPRAPDFSVVSVLTLYHTRVQDLLSCK